MKITWIGHAAFKLESSLYSLVLDPYEDGSVEGLKNMREKADAVLCSHDHYDHAFKSAVEIVSSGAAPFSIDYIDTFHDDDGGKKRGPNRVHIISDGKTRVCHFGDLGCDICSDKLMNIDVALIPVGGFYTIDGDTAAQIIKRIKPRITIPMHYRSEGFGFSVLSTPDPFLSHFDSVFRTGTSEIDTDDAFSSPVLVLEPRELSAPI